MILAPEYIQQFNQARIPSAQKQICHAPFKSIYFGHRGRLYTCCYNKQHILGTYPKQSIKEIWWGEAAKQIRSSLSNNDFSLGCHGCFNMIKAGNYNNSPVVNFDKLPQNPWGYPTKIDFELSNTCNLECIMCRGELSSSIRRNREKRPPIPQFYDEEFVNQLNEFIPHLKSSHFLGGEPFLIPLYFSMWERIIALNPQIEVSVQTNATILTPRVQRILDALPISISISIDSFVKETYQHIRKNANYEKVMKNIVAFRDYCRMKGTSMTVSYCPMQQNWHELPSAVEFCNDLDIFIFFNTVTFPYECALMSLPSTELDEIIAVLSAAKLPENTPIQRRNKQSYQNALGQIQYWRDLVRKYEHMFAYDKSQIQSLHEFYDRLSKYMQHQYGTEQAKQMHQDVKEKLDYVLLHIYEENWDMEHALQQIYRLDLQLVCDSVPFTPKSQLVFMFTEWLL